MLHVSTFNNALLSWVLVEETSVDNLMLSDYLNISNYICNIYNQPLCRRLAAWRRTTELFPLLYISWCNAGGKGNCVMLLDIQISVELPKKKIAYRGIRVPLAPA